MPRPSVGFLEEVVDADESKARHAAITRPINVGSVIATFAAKLARLPITATTARNSARRPARLANSTDMETGKPSHPHSQRDQHRRPRALAMTQRELMHVPIRHSRREPRQHHHSGGRRPTHTPIPTAGLRINRHPYIRTRYECIGVVIGERCTRGGSPRRKLGASEPTTSSLIVVSGETLISIRVLVFETLRPTAV